ncbi:MAG: tetratricopeptide repeat protein [Sediminimonas qiaohouensis]|uniref:Tetratricopeptide repeat protein n=2 Tax=Sediminimonas qiaohouensis TaxID=552061 RepID=A0A7C9HBJ6_9RHOB|nr:tetratricopeptide repeat protein [Sediminimonas qiaohouensis]
MAPHPQTVSEKIMTQLNAGQFKGAFKTAKAATRQFPKEPYFYNLAGLAQAQMGDERAAIPFFRQALKMAPGNRDVQNNLVQALISTGQNARALSLLEKLLPKRPDTSHVLYLSGMARMRSGDYPGALADLDKAVAEDPRNAAALNLRGVVRQEMKQEQEALTDYEASLAIEPNAPDTLSNLSLLLGQLHREEDALAASEKALAINPNHFAALEGYAILLNQMGRRQEALATHERILALFPHHAESLFEVSHLHAAEDHDATLARVDAAIAKVSKSSPDMGFLAFARASLLQQAGDIDGSDLWYRKGNDVFARHRPFAKDLAIAEKDDILSLFAGGPPLPDGQAQEPVPIFILGLPRSGTTLTEQMISSHPDVYGAGELATAGRLAHAHLDAGGPFDADAAARFAQDYRAALPAMPEGTRAFVDKMPSNYRLVGMLLAAFPNCVILHMRRDPRDVGLSMWRTYFSSPAMSFTFDQAAIALQINLYRDYMDHWKAMFGARISDVDYADLVTNPEGGSKMLAEACGLSWVEDMALPERNRRAVRTASVNQVRQGVHTRSVGGWRDHRDALSELLTGIDPARWPDLPPD